MIDISGYMKNDDDELEDRSSFISVNSCGYYRLVKRQVFETTRPEGRPDFQLLYVANGSLTFGIKGEMHCVSEGGVVIYQPREAQYYLYDIKKAPEVYWLHFSGAGVCKYLEDLGFKDKPWYPAGLKNEYPAIFDKIIRELQLKILHCRELTNNYALELFLLISRNMSEKNINQHKINEHVQKMIELINKNISSEHSIREYARLCNMSTCWFINCFKGYTGKTPQQYITDLRISKAKELLAYSSFNITEIASIVGYENPFYFSRIFKKVTAMSPREYKNRV